MKITLISLATIALIGLSSPSFSEDNDVGKKIYDRTMGRGCGTCHDIKTNPQLTALIKAGKLDKVKFTKVIKEGKNGMPMMMGPIMKVGAVKKAELTEEQAIDAVYNYLSNPE
jgi:mono/diheme cytochrome c family protein